MTAERAFIGLGSSLGDRLEILRAVVSSITEGEVAGIELLGCSRIYETRPVGSAENRFLNAAIEVESKLDAQDLLTALHELETRHGRVRRVRWEDRSLDLDLLWMSRGAGALSCDLPELRIPHPELRFRDFALAPLADLAPELDLRGQSVRETLEGLAEGQRTIEAVLLAALSPSAEARDREPTTD
jgi:2-amino-4-hydroxy-6-hydroxymethyldihydropteridine diphosphokinase